MGKMSSIFTAHTIPLIVLKVRSGTRSYLNYMDEFFLK
ncbi:hypothetical protein RV13_GL001582 [Enterococcus raffinosus]|nr:hypothetical protein RV13_GL001582 [Enterococcus raffinosus]